MLKYLCNVDQAHGAGASSPASLGADRKGRSDTGISGVGLQSEITWGILNPLKTA